MSDEVFELKETPAQDEFSAIPDGHFATATCTGVEKTTHKYFKNDDGTPQDVVNFEFTITDGEYKNRRVWGNTPTTFTSHENCKLRQWVQELLDVKDLTPGFKFKLADLVGCEARIVIGLQTWNAKDTGEARWRNVVDDVISLSSLSVASAPAEAVSVTPAAQPSYDEEPF